MRIRYLLISLVLVALLLPAVASAQTLLIYTTETNNSVQQALTDLSVTYDMVDGDSDWSLINFGAYTTVIIAMDGDNIVNIDASVQAVANFINGGGKVILIGGTCNQSWAVAVNTYLLLNNTADYCWSISSAPQLTVVDPGNPLATGLPSPYNFSNNEAGYYSIRSTDPAASVAAINGDGYSAIFSKQIGSGSLIWFINSPFNSYWLDTNDYNVLLTFLGNALGFQPGASAVPATDSTALAVFGIIAGLGAIFVLRRRMKAAA